MAFTKYTQTLNPYLITKRGDSLPSWAVVVDIDGSPAVLSSARMMIRESNSAKTLVFTVTVSVVDDTATIPEISKTDTASFPVGLLKYDLEVTLSSGVVRTWIEGEIAIIQDQSYV